MVHLSFLQSFLILVAELAVRLRLTFTLSSPLSFTSVFSLLIAYYYTMCSARGERTRMRTIFQLRYATYILRTENAERLGKLPLGWGLVVAAGCRLGCRLATAGRVACDCEKSFFFLGEWLWKVLCGASRSPTTPRSDTRFLLVGRNRTTTYVGFYVFDLIDYFCVGYMQNSKSPITKLENYLN